MQAPLGSQDSFSGVAELVRSGVLSGAALLAPHAGAPLFSLGSLAGAFSRDDPSAAEQFVRPFLDAAAPVDTLTLRGLDEKLVVFHRDARSICAVSRRRAVGVCVQALPCGTLVAEFRRPQSPHRVVRAVDAVCAPLR